MLARYILCDSPVLVRLSVLLGAEGSRDAKSCWTRAEGPATRSVHPRGLLLQMRSSGVVGDSGSLQSCKHPALPRVRRIYGLSHWYLMTMRPVVVR